MNKSATITLSLLMAICGASYSNTPSMAQEEKDPDYIMDTSNIGNTDSGVMRSEQLLELGSLTPGALSIEGEQSLRQGSLDRALTVLQRSVELAPMDMDVRVLYAQTLQKKFGQQKKSKQDPQLFNFLVKQWFFVYNKAEFFDQKMLGLNNVYTLTGTKPKRWESSQKFLARVMRPVDAPVKVAAKDGKHSEETESAPKKYKARSDFDLEDELTQSKQQPY